MYMKRLNQNLLSLTVLLALVLPSYATIILDDTWTDNSRTNEPFAADSGLFYVNTSGAAGVATLSATNGSMVLSNVTTTSRTVIGYFTADPANPITLTAGEMLKATLVFYPTNVSSTNRASNSLRVGMYYTDPLLGGMRTNKDSSFVGASSAPGSGLGTLGYFTGINFVTNFTSDTPIEFRARTNTLDNNLLGSTTGIYQGLGSGSLTGRLGTEGFSNAVEYTLVFSIAKYANSNVLTTTVSGANLNMSSTTVDTTFASYNAFDTLAIRCSQAYQTADFFNFSRIKIEVLDIATPSPSPVPIEIQLAGNNVVLTWTNSAFTTLLSAPAVTGPWTTNNSVTSPYTNAVVGGAQRIYRLIYP
jgi:hypothetical protein